MAWNSPPSALDNELWGSDQRSKNKKKRVNRSKTRVLLEEFNRDTDCLDQYLETAVCFYFPEVIVMIDETNYYPEFITESRELAEKELRDFIIRTGKKLGNCDLIEVAHKFFMSRNLINGFWSNYPKVVADKLDRICRRFPKVTVLKNKEDKFYFGKR